MGWTRRRTASIAVYDFGGGTFDISILKLHEGIFEVIATGGDTHLGGDDIDNLLIAIALDDIAGDADLALGRPTATREVVQAVRKAVIEAKIALSTADSREARCRPARTASATRARSRARSSSSSIAPVIARTAAPVRQALKDAGLTPEQIDEVVMVGGSTRIPAVRTLVDELFDLKRAARSRTRS